MNQIATQFAPAPDRRVAAPRSDRGGLTLLEVAVVLALLGLVLALSVPSLGSPTVAAADPLQRVLDTARRAAVRRGQWLDLTIEPDGRWVLEAAGMDDAAPQSGRVDLRRAGTLRLHVSPLGACWPASAADAEGAPALDPVRCRPRHEGTPT